MFDMCVTFLILTCCTFSASAAIWNALLRGGHGQRAGPRTRRLHSGVLPVDIGQGTGAAH